MTNRIPRLLRKYLGKFDHFSIIVEGLCKINHVIRGILLLAWTRSSKKSTEGRHSNLVALGTPTSGIL